MDLEYDVVVGGDFNKTIQRKELMERTMEELGMTNIMQIKLYPFPVKWEPGRHTINHVWGKEYILLGIVSKEIVPRYSVFPSNHLGLFVDI